MSNDRIEEHLKQLTWVADAVVRTRRVGRGSLPVAYLVALDEHGQERLTEAQRLVPEGQVAFVPRLPRTLEGALDEAELESVPVVGAVELVQWPHTLRQALGPVAVAVETAFAARAPSRLHTGIKPVSKRHGAALQASSAVPKRAGGTSTVPAFSSTPPSTDGWSGLSSLVELLERASARHGANGIWHLNATGGLYLQTYAELLREARQLANGLAERGVAPGSKVLLVLPSRYYFSALWACWLARATAVPQAAPAQFDGASPALDRLVHVWQDFGAPPILTEPSIGAQLKQSLGDGADVIDVTSLFGSLCPGRDVAPDDVVLALSTSGSTGRPKAALHSQRTLLAAALGGIRQNAYGPDDTFLNWMPLDHVGSIVALHLSALGVGASQAHVPTEHILERPLRWIDMLHELGATVTWAPHFAFGLINAQADLDQGDWKLSRLRVIINAGESIGSETAERFVRRLAPFGLAPAAMCPAWGMSETGSGMCFSRGLSSGSDAVALGYPIPGAAFRIVREDGQRLDEGEIGLLEVSGDSVFVGYREEAATRASFTSDGWFQTGDLGFLEAGQLFVTGRAKDEIVINGAKLAAQVVESAVESVAGVSTSFAAAFSVRLADSATDQLAVVLHTSTAGGARRKLLLDVLDSVRARCGVTPRFVVPVEQAMIPKTSIGKIQRRVLSDRFDAGELDVFIRQADLLLENENTLPNWFLRAEWTRAIAPPATSAAGARVVLFTNEAETPDLVGADPRVAWVISVVSGPEFAEIDATCFQIRPTVLEDYQRLLEAIEARGHNPNCFVHAWATQLPSVDAKQYEAGTPSSLLPFLQALDQARSRYETARALVVSRGVHAVVSGDRVHPRHGLVAGLVRSAANEMSWLSLRHVDIDSQDGGASAEPIVAELGRCRALEQVAYRAGKRWTLGLAPLYQEDFGRPLPLVRGGAYVVSGGAGALGQELVRRLGKELQARVLVLDRATAATRERHEPAQVTYRGVDVTDHLAVADAIASTEQAWQVQFDGVFHLAGSFEETSLRELTPSALHESMASKVEGALALHDYFKARPGSLFVSYSSTLAHFGGPRTAGYVCANAVLDSLSAYQRDECQLEAHSLCWSPWRNLGISADYSNESLLARHGYLMVDKENGWRSLLLALRCHNSPLLIGMDRNHAVVLRRTDPRHTVWRGVARVDGADELRSRSSLPVLTDGLGREVILELGARAEASGASSALGGPTAERTPPQTQVERQLATLWSDLLGLSDIAVDDHFFNRGGDSISATRLIARVREQFACDVSFAQLLAQPTLGELARLIARTEGPAPAGLVPVAAPAPTRATYPLTSSQARLWFLSQLDGGLVAYNMARAYRIDRPLDISTLERALRLLMSRHEPLRTLFVDGGEGVVLASVRDDLQAPITSEMCDCNEASDVATALRRATLATFDFARGPAWRSVLLAGDQQCVLLVVMHHIISDGWSFNILERELFDTYAALERGATPSWMPMPTGYGHFVSERAAATHDSSIAYWQQTLRDAPAGLDLPLDRERPTLSKFAGESLSFSVDEDLAKRLTLVGQEQGTSLFVSLYAAFCSLLFKYTRQQDIVIGVPASGRNDSSSEALIGFVANTLALRTQVDGAMPFKVLCQSVNRALIEALPHQNAPFEHVVRALDRGGDLSRNPLYQVLFAFQNSPRSIPLLPGRRVQEIGVPRHVATGDLTISIEPRTAGGLLGTLEYDSAIFDTASMRSFVEQYVVLLDEVSRSPNLRVDDVSLSRDADLPALITLGEGASRPEATAGSLHERVHGFATAYPDAVAIVTSEESISYAGLDALVARMAVDMASAGLVTGGVVAITTHATVGSVAAMVAASRLGAAFLPLDPELPPARQEQIAADAGAHAHVRTTSDGRFEVEVRSLKADRCPSSSRLRDAAYVVYTSGSTGQPKGVVVGRAGLANSLACQIAALGITRSSRVMNCVPASSDGGLGQILMALWSGATLCYPASDVVRSAGAILRFLRAQRVTHSAFVPSYLDALPHADLPDLSVITLGGEAVSSRQLSRWGKGRRVVNAYGPSEATITATLMDCADLDRKPAIGRPLPNTRVYVLDPCGRPCPVGCPGELYIGGVGVALGYVDETSSEAERFSLDPFRNGERLFRTGDRVRWLRDGNLEFLGRLDEQLKIRGFRVEPREIESQLQDAPSVEDCAVVVHPGSNEGPRLVAHVQPREGCTVNAGELKRFIGARLPKYMLPDHFQEIDRIPRTSSGKIDRAVLRQRPLLHALSPAPIAAATETERLLVRLWQQRLERPSLSRTDDFFEMGGHSLLAMRLIADIEKELAASITIADLFENPTPELMARRLGDAPAQSCSRSLIPMRRRGNKPALFLVHPAGGDVFCYTALAQQLEIDRPVYGLRDSGAAGTGLTSMAESYAREILSANHPEPFYIGGWSLGGVIAIEVARLLHQDGKRVAVILLDSHLPSLTATHRTHEPAADAELDSYLANLAGLPEVPAELQVLSTTQRRLSLWSLIERAHDGSLGGLETVLAAYERNVAAARSFKATPVTFPVALFSARDARRSVQLRQRARWRWMARGSWVERSLPGSHHTVLQAPNIQGTARAVAEYLELLEGATSSARGSASSVGSAGTGTRTP